MINIARDALMSISLALGSAFAFVPIALADVRKTIELITKSPVPANGVLRFSDVEGVTVRVVFSDGVEVPGEFVAPGIWRPEEPFEIGRYTADLSFELNPSLAEDREFEVIAAVDPSVEFVQIQVVSTVQSGEVLTRACCEAGAADVDLQPCATNCAPLCIPLTYRAKQLVEVTYSFDSESPLADQSIIRTPSSVDSGQYVEGAWSVEGAPTNLCGVAEVFSWLDESTTLAETCISNPKPDLSPIAETVSSFGNIRECTIPPVGYESQWCAAQAYACLTEVESLTGAEADERTRSCDDYYRLCDASMPDTAETAARQDAGKGTDHADEMTSEDTESDVTDDNDVSKVVPHDGCQPCALGYRDRFTGEWGWIVAGLVAIFARRRIRPGEHLVF